MPSGTRAPSPPGSPLHQQRVRVPKRHTKPLTFRHGSTARTVSSSEPLSTERQRQSHAEIDDDSLGLIAAMVPLTEHGTLCKCARVSVAWRRVFDPLIRTLIDRLKATISEYQCDDLLRRSTLWRERRRALRSSIDPERLLEVVEQLRMFHSAWPGGDEAPGQEAMWRTLTVAVRVTTALASTILAAGENPRALHQAPLALCSPNYWVVDVFGSPAYGELFVWEALQHADEKLECSVSWVQLAQSHGWRAIIEAASSEAWFVTHGLSPEQGQLVPEVNAMVRWSLAVMDEVGFMMTEKEARLADAQLREYAKVLRLLKHRRRRGRPGVLDELYRQSRHSQPGIFSRIQSPYSAYISGAVL